MESNKKGQTIRSKARNVIRRVIRKCDEEARMGQLFHLLRQANNRASEYTGVTIRTISRIRKEDSQCKEDEALKTPGRKRPRRDDTKFHCSNEDRTVIRNIIYDFYVEKKRLPSGPKLLAEVRDKIDFPWQIHSFYRLLRTMGFKWMRNNALKRVLVEKPSVAAVRTKYLRAMQYFRSQNRNIIYIDQKWVDNALCSEKYWEMEMWEMLGVIKDKSSPDRLLIVHAGGKNGFVRGAELIFKLRNAAGDNHEQVNGISFEKWVVQRLIPNIPPNSVIVMDSTPYNTTLLNKAPVEHAKRKEMINWLMENNVPHCETLRKCELNEIIESYKKQERTYRIDEILKLHGHVALRLPPYMCELNPIQLAWAQVKRKIQEHNPSILLSSELEKLTCDAVNRITTDEWENICKQVEQLEKGYWAKDGLVEDFMEKLILQEYSSGSESDSEDDEDED